MKTIFKVGMKVYDSVFFPESEGEVVKIEKQIDCERVFVQFDCLDYELPYTEQGRLTSTHNEATPTLSTSPYTFDGFEQKAPAKTYEEAVEWLENNSKDRVIYADEAYINEEYERAFEALRKLTILRDFYNEGWKPDWEDEKNKFCIEVENGKPRLEIWRDRSRVLAFKSHEIAYNFLEDQRELLEIAKPLL
jgi:hypothetical protein|nr:MAG TPA: hypothetical protein [Bacteriophage sp.]